MKKFWGGWEARAQGVKTGEHFKGKRFQMGAKIEGGRR
jgi:hypothetical protein